MIGKKHHLEWSQKGSFSLWFGSGLHIWAFAVITKTCYYACVFDSGMPSSPKIFKVKVPHNDLQVLKNESLKAKWDEKKQESKIYPLKFMSGRFSQGNFERKKG